MSEVSRSAAARIGIVLLNLPWPGLGLLRLQRLKWAIPLLAAPLLLLVALVLAYALLPVLTFYSWAALILITLVTLLATYLISMILSWRESRFHKSPLPWWSRWHSLVGVFVVGVVLSAVLPESGFTRYKTFYMPAESMAPTLEVNDRLVGHMRPPFDIRRGSLVLVEAQAGALYLKRVAAVGGDRLAMREGIVVLNNRPIPQHLIRVEQRPGMAGEPVEARRLSEQFPGEARPHEILDLGHFSFDDVPERVVAPGNIFVLGDNRDQSADSRVSHEEFGLEEVPLSAVRGMALFYLWGSNRGRIGEPLNR